MSHTRGHNAHPSVTIELLMSKSPHVGVDSFERLLWWLFAGSAGAKTRIHVVRAIKEEPRNAQQLSQSLGLDYTTVRHHLSVLEKNRMVLTEGDKYGKIYFLSDAVESHWSTLETIIEKSRNARKGGGGAVGR